MHVESSMVYIFLNVYYSLQNWKSVSEFFSLYPLVCSQSYTKTWPKFDIIMDIILSMKHSHGT